MGARPPHVKPPAYLSKSPPVPQPQPQPVADKDAKDDPLGLNPVRYGDWELKGIAVDF
ncbi:MAG: hypothetical protein RJB22_571 [Pseudomonadota bacterium]|jgi:hypothetical protein